VEEQLIKIARESCPLPVSASVALARDCFYRPPDTAWLKRLAEWTGQAPMTVPYCTNAWAYGDVARECVVLGPGSIDQAHAAEEWVEIEQLHKLASLYRRWWEVE
jgi:acetylornithine deacetylase/succinyl-diaminopimelate desuccinylase-like protein